MFSQNLSRASAPSSRVDYSAPFPIVEAFGLRFSNLTFREAVDHILAMAATPAPQFAVTPNVDHIVQMRRDGEMREVYRAADLVLCDGMPVKWALSLLGRPLKDKISGSDLFPAACAAAAQAGARPFLLGAGPGVADECARRLAARHPRLQVAGTFAPPQNFDGDAEAVRRIVDLVRAARPDVLFVALGTPRQEKFIHRHLAELGVPMSLGVGAAFDFLAGRIRRAPRWMRHAGLEWLWRVGREPRRLYRRYLIDDMAFFGIVWNEWRRLRSQSRAGMRS